MLLVVIDPALDGAPVTARQPSHQVVREARVVKSENSRLLDDIEAEALSGIMIEEIAE
jgi:hypothetical protein